jgi:hypothetical protein
MKMLHSRASTDIKRDYPNENNRETNKTTPASYEQQQHEPRSPGNISRTNETRQVDRVCRVLHIHIKNSKSTTSI